MTTLNTPPFLVSQPRRPGEARVASGSPTRSDTRPFRGSGPAPK